MNLNGKHILLGLTGGVACYKSAQLCRDLQQAGATVQVVMTDAACQFITPVTLQALSGRPVFTSQWDARAPNNMAHINLSREAHAMVIAPCSADFMARLVQGRADELLSLLCLARPLEQVPLLLAPAMNREMWLHPATQRNVAQLRRDGAHVLGVGCGEQACGETGDGRMLEPDEIVQDLVAALQPKLLHQQRVLITAGPTFEAMDPVRGITNHSSGKMGFAVAAAAHAAGAHVTLVAGPVHLPTPRGVERVNVTSAQDMLHACVALEPQTDIFIATAAVADWRVAHYSEQKIKKEATEEVAGSTPVLNLVENPDILYTLAHSPRALKGELYCVGFAAESHDLLTHAQAKRLRKGVPLLVGNIGPSAFGQDDNQLLLVDAHTSQELPRASKRDLGWRLIEEIARRRQT